MTSTPSSALVVGFAVTGQAAASALVEGGARVVAVDDAAPSPPMARKAEAIDVELVLRPSRGQLRALADRSDLVVLSPGVPPSHPVFEVAERAKIVPEVELAFSLCDRPVVAITGTNGKTTVTSLVAETLLASGIKAEAVGNIGRPFIEAVTARAAELFVVEVSSFQLAWTKTFRPKVACWLNFAPNHLDWHADLDEYASAKARIWANQDHEDVAVVNAEDPVVMARAASAPSSLVTFGLEVGDFREEDGVLLSPAGALCRADQLQRSLPHDCLNALAAAAVALATGGATVAVGEALRRGVAMRHRIELVGESGGVSWYDDSKATTPSAVLAALRGFESVVLVAGGRNKGLDLGAIPFGLEAESASGRGPGIGRLRGVVAIGESASEIVAAFAGKDRVPVRRAGSMAEAVKIAGELSRSGDAVVLSPGCASFDWYRNYGERGDDFARAARASFASQGGSR